MNKPKEPIKNRKALLIIDMQNDFFPGGSLPVQKAPEIIPVIKELLTQPLDVVLATKDWHPNDHISFAVEHGKQPGDQIVINNQQQVLWPVHCVQNTPGADFCDYLNRVKLDEVFFKGVDKQVDSYSAFFDNNHEKSTGLEKFLKTNQIDTLYVVGVATEYCVKYSVLDALSLDFKTYVIVDACRGVDINPGDCEKALVQMQEAGAILINSHLLQFGVESVYTDPTSN